MAINTKGLGPGLGVAQAAANTGTVSNVGTTSSTTAVQQAKDSFKDTANRLGLTRSGARDPNLDFSTSGIEQLPPDRWEGDTIYRAILVDNLDKIPSSFLNGETEQTVQVNPMLEPMLTEAVPDGIRISFNDLVKYDSYSFTRSNQNCRGFIVESVYKGGGVEQYRKGFTGRKTFYIIGKPFVIPSTVQQPREDSEKKPKIESLEMNVETGQLKINGRDFNSEDSDNTSPKYTVKFIYENGVEKIAMIKNFEDQRVIQQEYPEVSDIRWGDNEPEIVLEKEEEEEIDPREEYISNVQKFISDRAIPIVDFNVFDADIEPGTGIEEPYLITKATDLQYLQGLGAVLSYENQHTLNNAETIIMSTVVGAAAGAGIAAPITAVVGAAVGLLSNMGKIYSDQYGFYFAFPEELAKDAGLKIN